MTHLFPLQCVGFRNGLNNSPCILSCSAILIQLCSLLTKRQARNWLFMTPAAALSAVYNTVRPLRIHCSLYCTLLQPWKEGS